MSRLTRFHCTRLDSVRNNDVRNNETPLYMFFKGLNPLSKVMFEKAIGNVQIELSKYVTFFYYYDVDGSS